LRMSREREEGRGKIGVLAITNEICSNLRSRREERQKGKGGKKSSNLDVRSKKSEGLARGGCKMGVNGFIHRGKKDAMEEKKGGPSW